MPISPQDRAALIALAKAGVEAAVRRTKMPPLPPLAGVLAENRGCFVTLTNRDDLRGCIGTFEPSGPLGQSILHMAASAARDPRFVYNPITPAELPELTVEVSVLSPLEKTDHPEQLQVGVHGIYIIHGNQAGCFLPEVATDMNWTAVEFLDNCCSHKAGLPPGAWRQSGTDVYLFTSEKFSQ